MTEPVPARLAPRVGDVVHYVSYDTPSGEYAPACCAAVVTEVSAFVSSATWTPHVGLAVLNPTGVFFRTLAGGGCVHDPGEVPGADDDDDPPDAIATTARRRTYLGGTWHEAHP